MIRIHLLAAMFVLVAAGTGRAEAQVPGVERVVRRGDEQGLVLLLTVSAPPAPVDATAFTLLDAETGAALPFKARSRVDRAGCPFPSGEMQHPEDRLCLVLDGARMDPSRAYHLLARKLDLGGGASVGPGVIMIDPVGGSVEAPETDLQDVVTASYSLDLSSSPVDPRILVNGRQVAVDTMLNPRVEGLPLCYRLGGMDFSCQIRRGLEHGDSVEFRLVDRATGGPSSLPSITAATTRVEAPETPDQARFYLSGGFTRVDGSEEGTLDLVVRDFLLRPPLRWGNLAGRLEGEITPFADVSIASSDGSGGKLDFGAQLSAYVHKPFPRLRMIDLRITPRRESDQDNEVASWVYADVEMRLYVDRLHAGGLPKRGTYSLVPRFGYERGVTARGKEVNRLEANDPSRWMTGMEASFTWPTGWLLDGKVRLLADWEAQRIRIREGADPHDRVPQRWSLQGTMGITRNFGISLTRRKGRSAPSFVEQSTLELGATYLR